MLSILDRDAAELKGLSGGRTFQRGCQGVCRVKPCRIIWGYSPSYITSAVTTVVQCLGERVRESINTLRKKISIQTTFVSLFFTRLCSPLSLATAQSLVCSDKELLMVCVCELAQHWSQPTSVGPAAPVLQYAPVCWAICERSEMNREMDWSQKQVVL